MDYWSSNGCGIDAILPAFTAKYLVARALSGSPEDKFRPKESLVIPNVRVPNLLYVPAEGEVLAVGPQTVLALDNADTTRYLDDDGNYLIHPDSLLKLSVAVLSVNSYDPISRILDCEVVKIASAKDATASVQ